MKNINIKEVKLLLSIELFLSAFFFNNNASMQMLLITTSILIGAYDIYIEAIKKIVNKTIKYETLLVIILITGLLIVGENIEAFILIMIYKIGQVLIKFLIDKDDEYRLLLLNMKNTNLIMKRKIKTTLTTKLKVGDIIQIEENCIVPVDGILLENQGQINSKFITGLDKIILKRKDDLIKGGSINKKGTIRVKVLKTYNDSNISILINRIEIIRNTKTILEKTIIKYLNISTILLIIVSIVLIFVPFISNSSFNEKNIYQVLLVLALSNPLPLLKCLPVIFIMSTNSLFKNGILIKDNNIIGKVKKLSTIVVEKTKIITIGDFTISKIITEDVEKLLYYLNYAEHYSNHYIADLIKKYKKEKINIKLIKNYKEYPGLGIKYYLENEEVIVGNYIFLKENGIIIKKNNNIGTIVYVAVNHKYIGCLVISDKIKKSTKDAIRELKKYNIKKLILISGDNERIVGAISRELDFAECYSNLTNKDKLFWLNYNKEQSKGLIAYVGNEINNKDMLLKADVGISLNELNKESFQNSDIVITNQNLSKISEIIKISNKTDKIIKKSIFMSILVKIIMIIFTILHFSTTVEIMTTDIILLILILLNATRIHESKEV